MLAISKDAFIRFSSFIFRTSPNLAKHTYGRSPLEPHKIEIKSQHVFKLIRFVKYFRRVPIHDP